MRRRHRIMPGLLGFFLIASVYLVLTVEQTPWATDAVGVVLGLWLLWRFCTRGLHAGPLGLLLLFGAIPSVWDLYAYSTGDVQTTLLSFRRRAIDALIVMLEMSPWYLLRHVYVLITTARMLSGSFVGQRGIAMY